MDQFTVPKFIEHKAKIVGPLTFQQFIYVGTAGIIAFIFYFTLPFYFFILTGTVVMFIAAALAFGSISGRSFPEILKNFFVFVFAPKLYLWKKKAGPPPKLIKEAKSKPEEIKGAVVPAVSGKSRLKDLSNQIETK